MMVTHRRFTLVFALGCILSCSLAPHCASGSAVGQDDGNTYTFFAGARHLQQTLTPCPHQWAFDNFTNLEMSCPYVVNITLSYPKYQCCQALGDMLCPYASLVNDETSSCARNFFATLRLVAPNYTSDFFPLICTDPNSPLGISCSANSTGNQTTANFSPSKGSHSFGLTILLAIAILEILVLLF